MNIINETAINHIKLTIEDHKQALRRYRHVRQSDVDDAIKGLTVGISILKQHDDPDTVATNFKDALKYFQHQPTVSHSIQTCHLFYQTLKDIHDKKEKTKHASV